MKDSKKINQICQEIEFFHLSDKEKKALSLIKALKPSPTYSEKLGCILDEYCDSVVSVVKLAIYSPQVKIWCQKSEKMTSTWLRSLAELGEEKAFKYQFKKQRYVSSFSLLAGLILFYEYLDEQNSEAAKTFILYVAMQSFCSFHATYILVNKGLEILSHREDQSLLNKLINVLEVTSSMHGSPGYLLYALFTYRMSLFCYKKNPEDERISSFMHCCFRFLLTAHFLEKTSVNEMANADFGRGDLFTRLMDDKRAPSLKSSIKLSEVIDIFRKSKFVQPIEQVATSEAKQLVHHYFTNGVPFNI